MKNEWLIHEAKKWVGTMEAGGENRGPIVDHFIASTGGVLGSAWCLHFVRYCVDQVDKQCELIYAASESLRAPNILPKTGSCVKMWKTAPEYSKSLTPSVGSIVLWEHFDKAAHATGLGHAGIVTKVLDGGHWIGTVEGNTGPERAGDINREGDGVFEKTRSLQGGPRMRILGFISPWAKNSG